MSPIYLEYITHHNMIGDEILDNKGRTTPESSDMQALLAHMRDQGCSFVAAEGSSHALYLDRLNGEEFEAAIAKLSDSDRNRWARSQ